MGKLIMDRTELLDFLMNKRSITAGVAMVQQRLNEAQAKIEKGKKKFRGILIALWIFMLLVLFGGGFKTAMPLILIIVAIYGYKYMRFIMPGKEAETQALADLDAETSNADYIAGKQGFPEKFYNYFDIFRLWKLIDENRARDLQEAFNILETQQFQETQLSMQEEMRGLQQDIAANSRLAAVSSTVSAFNSFRK